MYSQSCSGSFKINSYAAEAVAPGSDLRAALALASVAALAVIANVAEGLITLPIPMFRLGLANAFVLLALWKWGVRAGFVVAAIKVLAAAIVLGTLLSPVFPMNAGGTASSWGVMAVVAVASRKRLGAIIPVSCLGGVAHAAWQIAYLYWLTGGAAAVYAAPALALWGAASGALVGVITSSLLRWEMDYASPNR